MGNRLLFLSFGSETGLVIAALSIYVQSKSIFKLRFRTQRFKFISENRQTFQLVSGVKFGFLLCFLDRCVRMANTPVPPPHMSDQDLYHEVTQAALNAPQRIQDIVNEVVSRWHVAFTAV